MPFESLPPIIYVRNLTNEVIKKLIFKFELGSIDSKMGKLKPNAKNQVAIPVWGVKLVNGSYQNLTMTYEHKGNKFSYKILDEYNKRINLLVEIFKVNDDGSFEFKTKVLNRDEQG